MMKILETMTPLEIKDSWVVALRNGAYTQTKETIYNPNNKSFCCLGVLGKCAGYNETSKGVGLLNGQASWTYDKINHILGKMFPRALHKDASVFGHIADAFVDANDMEGKTFPEIADMIEDMWTKYGPE